MDGVTSFNTFLALHKPQLVLSGVPEQFWSTLCKKLCDQIFDAGLSFQLVQIDYEGTEKMPYDPFWSVFALCDIDQSDPSHIYLVDHAWTFKTNKIKSNLRNIPGLLDRMCRLMQVSDTNNEDKIEKVSQEVWKYAHTYALVGNELSVEDRIPLWYVLDELGSGIIHSDNCNMRAIPFVYIPNHETFTLIFPIKNIQQGEPITRNFVEGEYPGQHQRDAMLIPWKYYDYFSEDFTQHEPDNSYFLDGHIPETLPNLDSLEIEPNLSSRKLKVYSEYNYINEYLTANEFEIVNSEDDADILWYLDHFKNFRELSENSPYKYVNQFPFEFVITIKDLLAIVARRAVSSCTVTNQFETGPIWLPTTFNLKTELPKLVTYYMLRKKNGLDNNWICKPYNLARGLDIIITDNLNCLCRLPLSGPKIAQKYVEDPVLFNRPGVGLVKFDIRYVILLNSVRPTEVFVYNNFFLRFANKPFDLNDFEDYEKHFTVMNYTEGVSLYRMLCNEFQSEWANQYSDIKWSDVEKSIFEMISALFTAATSKEPPCGIAKSPQSRALYAADLMLCWHEQNSEKFVQPKLLEINWMPDCQRACQYYPDFYNDIFSVMFLNKQINTCTKIL